MKLSSETIALADRLGLNRTDSVERLFASLPVFGRAIGFLEALAADSDVPQGHRDYASALLLDLEDLHIQQVVEDAIGEGAIEVRKSIDGESVWIV